MDTLKLSILFFLLKNRMRPDGKLPLYCRLTYNGERKQFALGLFTSPATWSKKLQQVIPPDKHSEYINDELSLINNKVNQVFLYLKLQDKSFSVEDIYQLYLGNKPKIEYGLLEYYKDYLEKRKKLIDIEITQSTWDKFYYIFNDLKNFISTRYNKKDVKFTDIDMFFLSEFEYYLKTVRFIKQVTINKNLQRFKSMVKTAVEAKIIEFYPFVSHKPKKVITEVIYLTEDELFTLENFHFSQKRLQQVKDLFIFCCYTGLAYQEMSDLKPENLIKGYDGNVWISMYRKKTQRQFTIPLLDKASVILTLYRNENDLLPKISNQKFNSYLKEIAEIVGINKNLTHHTARKTFASTVLLYNDIPIEVVSELLGHSKITVTQEYYAKVVNKKLGEQMARLNKKLKP